MTALKELQSLIDGKHIEIVAQLGMQSLGGTLILLRPRVEIARKSYGC